MSQPVAGSRGRSRIAPASVPAPHTARQPRYKGGVKALTSLSLLLGLAVGASAPALAAPGAKPAPVAAPATTRRPAPAAPRLVTTVEGISEYALANGMRVLLFPDT